MTDLDISVSAPAPVMPAADPNDVSAIVRAKAVLVSLEITTWSGRRLDRRVTDSTNAREGAGQDAGRYNKHLLGGKVDSFAATIATAGASRVAHYKQTLPWTDEGSRLLPIPNYYQYAALVRTLRDTFRAANEVFFTEYQTPEFHAGCAARLGAMYDPNDYPSIEELRKFFTFRIGFMPIPAAADIRLDLPPEVTNHIERSITARVENAVSSAVRDGWDRLYSSVERIRDRLQEIAGMPDDGPSGRLHSSLFSSAIETAETLRRLNVLADPALDDMAARIIDELGQLDPKAIRKDPDAMTETAAKADAMLAAMAGIYGGAS